MQTNRRDHRAAGTSLAQYVLTLRAGSRCHCCGGPLAIADPNVSGDCLLGMRVLKCPHCGGEVAGLPGSSSAQEGDRAVFAGAQRPAA
ncbi:MAG: hypothetical protein M1274_08240 [Actinobacteria bacterium]|nr:hypothetical protein [Actinomycetota bacterium]